MAEISPGLSGAFVCNHILRRRPQHGKLLSRGRCKLLVLQPFGQAGRSLIIEPHVVQLVTSGRHAVESNVPLLNSDHFFTGTV